MECNVDYPVKMGLWYLPPLWLSNYTHGWKFTKSQRQRLVTFYTVSSLCEASQTVEARLCLFFSCKPEQMVKKHPSYQGFDTPQHDDVIKLKHFPRCWPFVRGIRRSLVNSPHKCQWRGGLMISLNCVWINSCINNREAGDLRRYRAHYDVIVMQRWCDFTVTSFCFMLLVQWNIFYWSQYWITVLKYSYIFF